MRCLHVIAEVVARDALHARAANAAGSNLCALVALLAQLKVNHAIAAAHLAHARGWPALAERLRTQPATLDLARGAAAVVVGGVAVVARLAVLARAVAAAAAGGL